MQLQWVSHVIPPSPSANFIPIYIIYTIRNVPYFIKQLRDHNSMCVVGSSHPPVGFNYYIIYAPLLLGMSTLIHLHKAAGEVKGNQMHPPVYTH